MSFHAGLGQWIAKVLSGQAFPSSWTDPYGVRALQPLPRIPYLGVRASIAGPKASIRSVRPTSKTYARRLKRRIFKRSRPSRLRKRGGRFKRRSSRYSRRRPFRRSLTKRALRTQTKTLLQKNTLKSLVGGSINLIGVGTGTYATSYTQKCQWYTTGCIQLADLEAGFKSIYNVTDTSSVDGDAGIQVLRQRRMFIVRNNGSTPFNLQLFKLHSRKTFLDSSYPTVFGTNPGIISNTTYPETALQTTAEDYREVDYLPHDNTNLVALFKIKGGRPTCLMPGEERKFKIKGYRSTFARVHNKQMYNVADSSILGNSSVRYHRSWGPVYMFKFWGCISHDEDSVVAPMDNTDLEPRFSGFNADTMVSTRLTVCPVSRDGETYLHGRSSAYPMPATAAGAEDAYNVVSAAEAATGA